MQERAGDLHIQMESARAETAQRQDENVRVGEQFVQFEAERNAGEAREGLLQLESEQVRARLTEIDELLRNTRQQLDLARDRRGEVSATAAKLQSDLQHPPTPCWTD